MTAIRLTNPGFETLLEQTDCCVCGTVFAVPQRLIQNRREYAGSIHCPNGHVLSWAKSHADKLREELEAERRRTQAALTRANEETARAVALEKERDRQRKRAKAGLCSCCNRHFTDLQRHMSAKHKDKPS